MTYREMRDQVVHWLGLQDISAYNETTLVNEQLYLGTLDLLARTRCVVRCVDLRVEADVGEYTLDHAVLALVDLEDGRRRARRDETLHPSFTLIRADVLRLSPTPSEAGEVQVWAVKRPQRMVADADSPSFEQFGAIPDEYQDAIVTYCLWKMSDYTDDATAAHGERYRILYEGQDGNGGRLSQIRASVNKRGTARAPRAKVTLSPAPPSGVWVG